MANDDRMGELLRAQKLAAEFGKMVNGSLSTEQSKDLEEYCSTVIATALIAVWSAFMTSHARKGEVALAHRVREILSNLETSFVVQLDSALIQCVPEYESVGNAVNLLLTTMFNRSPSVTHGIAALCAVIAYVTKNVKEQSGFDLREYLHSEEGAKMVQHCLDSIVIPMSFEDEFGSGKDAN